MKRALAGTAALAIVLTGCGSSDPRAERRADVEAVVLAANDRDATAVREAVEDLLSTLREQVANNEVEREEAERLRAIALRIAETVGVLDAAPSPSPTPPPEEPSPEPTEVEETEEPSPEPTEEPSPEPTEEEPSEEPSPIVEVPVEESPTPASVSQPAASPQGEEPTPAPTA